MTASVSPEVIEKWRSDFESEISLDEYMATTQDDHGKYVNPRTRTAFSWFCRGRQSAVIELPDFQKDYSMDSYWPGYNDGLRTAANAIESQGYRVEVNGD